MYLGRLNVVAAGSLKIEWGELEELRSSKPELELTEAGDPGDSTKRWPTIYIEIKLPKIVFKPSHYKLTSIVI